MSNHFLGSKISGCIIIVREHKCYHRKHPLCSSSFPSAFIVEQNIIQYGKSLCSVGVLAMPPPNFLPTLNLLTAGERESLEAVQALFTNNQNTGVLSVTNCSTIWAARNKVNSIPARLSRFVKQKYVNRTVFIMSLPLPCLS